MSSNELNVRAAIILDVIGKPPEHLIESLERIIDEIDKEKGITVKTKEIKVPTLMKDQKDFYTTFAEIEVEVEDILYLTILLFKYMPAHIEIISPETIALTNNGVNDILNELIRRLHGYDEIARILQAEKAVMLKKIQEITGKTPEEVFKKPEPPKEQKPTKKNPRKLKKPKAREK